MIFDDTSTNILNESDLWNQLNESNQSNQSETLSNKSVNQFDWKSLSLNVVQHLSKITNDDASFIAFLSTCRDLHRWKQDVAIQRRVKLKNIIGSKYYDNFTNVIANKNDLIIAKKFYQSNSSNILPSPLPKKLIKLELIDFMGNLRTWTRQLDDLRYLIINKECRIKLKKTSLPKTLSHLIWESKQQLSSCILPPNLIYFRIDSLVSEEITVPKSLKCLDIGRHAIIGQSNIMTPKFLPEGLITIKIDCNLKLCHEYFPSSLEKILIGKHCKMSFDNIHSNIKIIKNNR